MNFSRLLTDFCIHGYWLHTQDETDKNSFDLAISRINEVFDDLLTDFAKKETSLQLQQNEF